jgi:outer membrane lipoprotein-sorting protein
MNAAVSRFVFHSGLTRIALCLLLLQPAFSFASNWDIDRLMQALAAAKPGRASFVEKKYLSIVEGAVQSSGELVYTAPNRLEKRTFKPKPEVMLVEGDVLTIERGRQKHTLQLQEYPELAVFINSIRGTLAGDRTALERSYKLKLEGGAERWTLLLFPTDPKIANTIHLIRIAGNRADVRSIDVIQTDGDRSSMTIDRIAPQ